MFRFFLQEDVKSWDLSKLTYCTIAGEALSPDVFHKWYEATGIKLMEGFGQTETTDCQPRGHGAKARLHGQADSAV